MKHTTLLLIYSCLLFGIYTQGHSQERTVVTKDGDALPTETLPVPTINIGVSTDGGSSIRIRISCEIADTEIYYTLDDTDPTKQSPLYTDFLAMANQSLIVVKAIATKKGYRDSPIAKYTHIGSGIVNEQVDKTVASRIYISPSGIPLRLPVNGINIAITTYEDGSQETHKVIWKP